MDQKGVMMEKADAIYKNYREGTIKRHVGLNGRYMQYVWLRTKDQVDETQLSIGLPDIDLRANQRVSQHLLHFSNVFQEIAWLPIAYDEPMKRSVPAEYNLIRRLGFIPTEPGESRIPLYEWKRNSIKESEIELYKDHYYSTDPQDPVARYRYLLTGIVGYVFKDDFLNCITLFIGYDEAEKNHRLTTKKTNTEGLKNFHRLCAIHNSSNRSGNPYEFREYRIENSDNPYMTDNLYSADKLNENNSIESFQSQKSIAGGGDNPLYQGGLALATFSLEHKHQVSQHSLLIAKKLFDFIESSEELTQEILEKTKVGTGFLRRRRHNWWPHQYGNGSKWGASADEMTGVIFGIKFFLDATANSTDIETQDYHQRAVDLLKRIAIYLRDHHWVYVDTRVSQNAPETWLDEKMVKSYQMGTLAWQFAFSTVFKQYLGDDHIGDFGEIKEIFLRDLDLVFGISNLTEIAEVITHFTCLKGLQLSYGIALNDPYEVYSLLVQNMAEFEFIKRGRCEGSVFEDSVNKIKDDFKYFNHAMLMYTAILVFEMEEETLSRERRVSLAKHFIKYIKEMLGCMYGNGWFQGCMGPAAYNVLFAIVGKYAYKQATIDEIASVFHETGMRPEHARGRAAQFEKMVLDRIIDMSLVDVNNSSRYYRVNEWQEDLPLGHPKQFVPNPEYPCEEQTLQDYPWVFNAPRPFGIGRNQAWEYPDMHFEMWDNGRGKPAEKAFKEVGPLYSGFGPYDPSLGTDNWCADAVALKLKEYARAGRQDIAIFPGPGLNIEAGGNDYLLMRMLATNLGLVSVPNLTGEDTPIDVMPLIGASPW